MSQYTHPRRRPLWTAALVATATLTITVVGLTGCAVSFTPDTEPAPTSPSAPVDSGEGESEAPGSSDPEESPAAGDEGESEPSEGLSSLPTRADWEERVSSIVSCVDGRADIVADAAVVELESDCDTVTVSGAGFVVLTQNVGSLEVTGDAGTVIAAGAESVAVSGAGNYVLWESGTPVVSDTGTINVVLPAEGN